MGGYSLGSTAEWSERFDALVRVGNALFGLRIGYKNKSRLMRFLGVVLFFVPGFMERYTTTIGSRVWFPDADSVAKDPRRYFKVLAHELVHMERSRGFLGPGFAIRYLFPQVLAPLALLSLLAFTGSLWWLLCLLFLAAALPWPAPGRADEELRGYAMSNVLEFWQHGRGYDGASVGEWIEEQFVGWSYYKMAWRWAPMRQRLILLSSAYEADSAWVLGYTIRQIAFGAPGYVGWRR